MNSIKSLDKKSFFYGLSTGIILSTLYNNRYLIWDILIGRFTKIKAHNENIYRISRIIPINKTTFLEYGIIQGQYFRLIDENNCIIIGSKKLTKCIHTNVRLEYFFEDDYSIIFSMLDQYVRIEIFDKAQLLYSTLRVKDSHIKKISLYSKDLDHISDFLQ